MPGDVTLEFLGFESESALKNLAQLIAENLQTSSPSDSFLKLVLKKGVGVAEASCKIASQVGTFVADSVSENPYRAVQEIEWKIKSQLDNWKQQRFTGESSGGGYETF